MSSIYIKDLQQNYAGRLSPFSSKAFKVRQDLIKPQVIPKIIFTDPQIGTHP